MWRNSWMTSSEKTLFRGIWFLQFVRTNLQPCWDDTGFGALVKSDAPLIIITHCVLHRHVLATKSVPPKLCRTASSKSCVIKWALHLRYFCTILTFGGYPWGRCWIMFLTCVWVLSSFSFWRTWLIFSMLSIISINICRTVESTSSKRKKTWRRLQSATFMETTNRAW